MKILFLIARLLLGLTFVVFGLNGFLNFISGPMPLLLGSGGVTNRWRRAAAGESLRASRSGVAWTGNCEHTLVSLITEPEWNSFGTRRDDLVVHSFLRASAILLRDICAAGLTSI